MGIFDKLKSKTQQAVTTAARSVGNKRETFTFAALPESLAEMQALPEASLDTPFKTAALTVLALCAYAADKNIGTEMLNWLRGPRPLNGQEISFLNDRFRDGKTYLPFTYFVGKQSRIGRGAGLYEAVHPLRRRRRPPSHQDASARLRRQVVPLGAVPADRRPHTQVRRPVGII